MRATKMDGKSVAFVARMDVGAPINVVRRVHRLCVSIWRHFIACSEVANGQWQIVRISHTHSGRFEPAPN